MKHPRFGHCLIAKRDLPAGYRCALFGKVMHSRQMPEADKEWGFETNFGYFINPVHETGAQVQYTQCPGPNEKVIFDCPQESPLVILCE